MKIGCWILLHGPRDQKYFALLKSEEDLKFARALLASNFVEVSLYKCKHCKARAVHEDICLGCLK